jgi:hypothetical protein
MGLPISANDKLGSQRRTSTGVVQQARALFNVLADSPGRKRLLLLAIGLAIVISATAVALLRLNGWNKPFYDALDRIYLPRHFNRSSRTRSVVRNSTCTAASIRC